MSVRDALDQLRVKGREDPKANIFKLLQKWLVARAADGKWLIILDSADDTDFLLEPPVFACDEDRSSRLGLKRRIDYLPTCPNGSVLVTTRSIDAALWIVGNNDVVPVRAMDDIDALSLLRSKLGTQDSVEDLATLAHDLGNLPLAMTQAAAYIRQRRPGFPIRMYIERLEKQSNSKRCLLHRDEGDLRRDRDASNSVLLTWEISFRYIKASNASAADLLSLMCFYDGRSIPTSLLNRIGPDHDGRISNNPGSDSPASSVDDPVEVLEEDIRTLTSFSFVTTTNSTETFAMHRLVQDAMRRWLREGGHLESWTDEAVSRLASNFPEPQYGNWGRCRALIPHVMSMQGFKPRGIETLKTSAKLYDRAALYTLDQGDLCSAETLYSSASEAWNKIHGPESLVTMGCMDNIAGIYWLQGRWSEAESLDSYLLETKTKTLSRWHPEVLINITRLSSRLEQQGRYQDVEDMEEKVLEDSSTDLGPNHEATLSRKSDFASILWNHNAWDKGLKLKREVAESRADVLGKNHEDTMKSLADLAECYRSQRTWKECEDLEREIVQIKQNLYGPKHVSTLDSMASLALVCKSQAKWSEATELEKLVIAGRMRELGETHPATMAAMSDLAATHHQQARRKDAEDILSLLVQRSAQRFGNDNINTLRRKANLANTYSYQGRWEQAEKLHMEVKESRTRVLGEDHPETLESMSRLIQAFNFQGKS